MSNNNDLALTQVLESLRGELSALYKTSDDSGKELVFEVKGIEIELHTKVTKSDQLQASGGVKFWVVDSSLSAKQNESAEQFQKIKLQLSPVPQDNKNPKAVNIANKIDPDDGVSNNSDSQLAPKFDGLFDE